MKSNNPPWPQSVDEEALRKALGNLNGRYHTAYLYRHAKNVLDEYFKVLNDRPAAPQAAGDVV